VDVFATTGAVRRAGGASDYSVSQAPVVLATTPVTAPSVDPASPSTAISAPAACEVSPPSPPLLFVLS
jgi:hypothetical protein